MTRSKALLPFGLISTLLVSGCAVGPDYKRPDVTLPSQFQEVASVPTEPSVPVQRNWWTHFNDANLNRLVETALKNNADLAQATARIEQAEAVLRQAGAALYPELGLEGGAARARTSEYVNPMAAGVSNNFRLAAATAFELDFWGRLRRATEAARAQALATVYAKDTVELSLISNVAQSYLTLRALDAQIEITRETLATRERTQNLVQSRAEGGIASPLEVQQAEIVRAGAAAQLAELQRQRALVENQLVVLTGEYSLKIPDSDLRDMPVPPVPPPGLPSELLNARPDIRQAEAQLAATNALIGVARAELFPNISLTGNFGGQSRELSDLFNSGARIWSMGAVLDLPLFDAGRRSARVDEVTAQQKQALSAYVQSIRVGFREVNDAIVNLRQTAEAELALQSQVQAATRAVELAETRYRAGYSGFLEVLDTQRSANDASLEFIRNRQQRLAATVSLFRALGGGWTDQGPVTQQSQPENHPELKKTGE